jgi:(p)ppGpp synthase/HD superfamily hydrolase
MVRPRRKFASRFVGGLCDSQRRELREDTTIGTTTTPRLGPRFELALAYAAELHRTQTRKGGHVPYLGHLLSVAGLVIEAGGSETQAIAGLLHDAVEDQGGPSTLAEIKRRFGDDVALIVSECSDTDQIPKPPWQERKSRYIQHLAEASDDTILVSLADKVDNARAIVRDLRIHGSKLWERFSVNDPEKHLWYYTSLLEVYGRRRPGLWLVDELRHVIAEVRSLVAQDSADGPGQAHQPHE